MKKLIPSLMLLCSLMLLLSIIFAVTSFAADKSLSDQIPGAKRTHIDFTDIVYDRMKNDNGANEASPKLEIGTHPIAEMVLGKYGHLRTVTGLDGNTWYEWLFEYDNTEGATNHDSVLLIESQLDVSNISYYIQEFDMTTRTDFPGNMQILFDTRAYNGSTEAYRHRLSLAQYDAVDSVWKSTNASFSLEANEWAHITIVAKIVMEYKTSDDGVITKNYGKSTANLYINGQFFSSQPLMAAADVNADATVKIQYMGIGYSWGVEHTGTQADDSIVLDNVATTQIPLLYAADKEYDKLAPLFREENPETDITDISTAIVWSSAYSLPDTQVGVAAYIPEEGEEYVASDIEEALWLIKENECETAIIRLYANRYKSVHIDSPCTIELNKFSLLNGYTTSSDLVATYDAKNKTITFAYDATKSATFQYYDSPYENIESARLVKTQVIVAGNVFSPAITASGLIPVTVNGKTGYGANGEFEIYDENGNRVTISQISEMHKGKTYLVCPATHTVTLENTIVFYHIKQNGGVTFYDSTDLLVANADKDYIEAGTLVLVADATYSAPIKTGEHSILKIDLGGNTLASNISVSEYESTYKGMSIFFYSTKEGAKIDTQGKPLLNVNSEVDAQMGHSWYFGHTDLSTQSPYRLEIRCMTSVGYVKKGCAQNIYLANSDIYVKNGSNTYGVFGVQQARVPYTFQLWNCNLFTSAALYTSGGNTATGTVSLIDSNIYGTGRNVFGYFNTNCNGETTIVMQNSKIYNMSLGSDKTGNWTGKIQMDKKSKLSFLPNAENTIIPTGYTLISKEESVEIDGVTYVTAYQLVSENTEYATFHIYGVSIDQLTPDTPVMETQRVPIGSWFSATSSPEGESFYDPSIDIYHILAPSGYEVYDQNGNLVNKTAVDESDADAVYNVCVSFEKTPLYFYQKLQDGTYVPGTSNKLTSLAIPEGATVVLLQDCVFTYEITLNNNRLDLNGNTLYTLTKGPDIRFSEIGTSFIYSSKAGAQINALNAVQKGTHLFVFNSGANAYLGYVDTDTPSPYPITISSDSFTQVGVADVNFYLQGIHIVGNGIDNYGMFCARYETTKNVNIYLQNCSVVMENRGILVCSREQASDFNVVFENTEIFFNLDTARPIFAWYDESPDAKASVTFDNSNIYGNFHFDSLTRGSGVCTVTVKGCCKFTSFSDTVLVKNGYQMSEKQGTYTFSGLTVPQNGMYGNQDAIYGNKTYSYAYASAFDANAYKAQAYQNMTLDTNVVGNLYIPADIAVLSATFNGQNLLDTNKTLIIGDKTYYVLTVEVAPKYGNLTATITVNLADGNTVDFLFSVGNYAKAIFALDDKDNQYIADSQTMMKYVLTYIKEVAVKFGGADESTIFAGIDYKIETKTEIKELAQDTSAINTYVTHAALNLDAYAGFAFKVAAGFTGTIRVEMKGADAIEKTYSAEAPAGENEVIVLENVPAYLFRGDITVTVTPAKGDGVRAAFNLATYMKENGEAYTVALYAYSVAAEEYNTKYPTVKTVD